MCIDIPAHIITELPQKCSFLHTHALLKRSTFCDTHGSDRRKLNLDSSAKKLDPNMYVYTSDDVLSMLNEVVCIWLTTPNLHKVTLHAILPPTVCYPLFVH